MKKFEATVVLAAGFVAAASTAALAAPPSAPPSDPWADNIVSFDAGVGGSAGYDNPLTTLGSPERYTGEGVWPSSVTPFNSPWGADELVSLGEGGHLTVSFNEAVTNDSANPFGIDLLIFGNAFYGADGNSAATGLFSEGGTVELSADGVSWTTVFGVEADGGYPTLGFNDETNPFGGPAGTSPTDFTRPVDPNFDAAGLTLSEIIAGYDGSGGGLGIDIGALGFASISYVRISNAIGSGLTPEIDGFADVSAVPTPGTLAMCSLGTVLLTRRRRSR